MFINKSLHMDPHASRLVHPVTKGMQQVSVLFSLGYGKLAIRNHRTNYKMRNGIAKGITLNTL